MAEDKTIKIQLTEEGSSRDPSQSTPDSGPTNEEVEQVLKDYLQSSETIVAAYREAEEALKDLADSSAKAADAAGGGKGGGGGQGTSFDFPDPDDGDSDPFKGYKGPGGSSLDFDDEQFIELDDMQDAWDDFLKGMEEGLDGFQHLHEQTEEIKKSLGDYATETASAIKAVKGLVNGEKEATAAFFKLSANGAKAALAIGALIVGLIALKKLVDEMTEQLKGLSAQLARQLALNEVRQVQTDIALANQIGGDLAVLSKSMKDIDISIQELKADVIKSFEPLLSLILEIIKEALDRFKTLVDLHMWFAEKLEEFTEFVVFHLAELTKNVPLVGKVMKALYDWLVADNTDEKGLKEVEDDIFGTRENPVKPFAPIPKEDVGQEPW